MCRSILCAAVALLLMALPRYVPAQDSKPAAQATAEPKLEEKPAEIRPAVAAPLPELQPLLERLNRLEREVLELRTKSGKIPGEKVDQRVVILVDSPYLGALPYNSSSNPRMVAAKLMFINLTPDKVQFKRENLQLSCDGQLFPWKELTAQQKNQSVQVGQQSIQLQQMQIRPEFTLAPGASLSSWFVFTDLPPGNHVPQFTLKLKLGEAMRDVDVNASQRDTLGLTVERMGPRGSLGMLTVSGELNSINIGTLVEELDRFSAEKIARVVLRWTESAPPVDNQLLNWLHTAAAQAGKAQSQNDSPYPQIPVTIRELHLAAIPGGANQYGWNVGGRVHKTDAEAVLAALQSAYEVVPRDELFQAIQTGTRLEKAAALAGGGGRLAADKLPLLLQSADDNDPVIQNAALVALSHFGEPEAIDKLLSYAKKNVAPLSETAVASLAQSRYAASHTALLTLLNNEPPESKKGIVKILARYPRPIWSEPIYEFVKDSRSGLNVEAVDALVQVGHPKLIEVLTDALNSKDEQLSAKAFSILASRADAPSEAIALKYTLDRIEKEPPTDAMLGLLQRVKDKRSLPLIIARFDATQNKAMVIQTLTLIGDNDTAKFLAEKYNNLESSHKAEVLRALSRLDLKKFHELASQALLSSDSSIISHTVQGLQEQGGPEAVAILIEGLEKAGSSYAWNTISNALAVVGNPAARAALYKARSGSNREKRSFAMNALRNMRQRSPGYGYMFQAQQAIQQKKHKEAINFYDMAIQLDPELPDAYSERGNAYLQQEKFAEAGKDFAKALELDSWNSTALTGLCIVMVVQEGKIAEAIQKVEESRDKFDDSNLYSYNAACVYGRAVERLAKDDKAENRDQRIKDYTAAAVRHLKHSIEHGFEDLKWMQEDPDLKAFRELPEFKALATVKPKAATEVEGENEAVEAQDEDAL